MSSCVIAETVVPLLEVITTWPRFIAPLGNAAHGAAAAEAPSAEAGVTNI